ncbi:MAG: VWA domain-containing protein [Candidatus Omnitrophica bacterium]|nr:VWA domain-containing protein [Candidatus Omnitrophota bacterium]
MKFAQPYMFHLFWLTLCLAIFLWSAFFHHRQLMERFVQGKLQAQVAGSYGRRKKIIKNILIILVFIFSIFALARPQWGYEWQEIKRKGIDILVVVDTSKSMLTQDVKPNRLERTKLAVKDLLKKLKGDRIGLIAFAGDAFLLCPLTGDYNGFMLSLNELGIDSVPRGGTNIERAIEVGLKSFDKVDSQYKIIIVITDGENLEGDPIKMAKKAKGSGVKVYTIGIGTKEGDLIQVSSTDNSTASYLKDKDGNYVKSRLNEHLLQEISTVTDGLYVKSSGAQFGLDLIYDKELSNLEKREIENKMKKKFLERFQLPITIALIFLLLETCISTRKKMYN